MTSRTRNWIIGFAVAIAYSAAQATQITIRGAPIPWPLLFIFEVPVWASVVLASPVVFWLARRFPLQGTKTGLNVVVHLFASVVVTALEFLLIESLRRAIVSPLVLNSGLALKKETIEYATYSSPFLSDFFVNLGSYGLFFTVCYFTVVVLYHSAYNYRELVKTQLRSSELQSLLAKSQLDALKIQLQPHFLFNTLNTVSSLMSRDVSLARRMLARLSDLLTISIRDFTLHEGPLVHELEFLDCYLEIQDARFGDRLRVVKEIDSAALDVFVPRMILQPLVENSIRHAMKPGDEPLTINIAADVSNDRLTLDVRDDGTGLGSVPLVEGLGLQNTRQKLSTLYGPEHRLDVTPVESGGVSVRLTIPARYSEDEATGTYYEHIDTEVRSRA